MNQRHLDQVILLTLTLLVRLGLALITTRPGYMDAAYYAAGAVRMAGRGGLSEPFVWNYLDNPSSIPHPGFLYWMPLPSLLGAPLAALFPGSFFALQVPFAILSALLPLIAYSVASQAGASRHLAWTAGLLAVFSGFFFPYWTLTETFAPFALFGSLGLWLAGIPRSRRGRRSTKAIRWLSVGLLAGLAHLTRADGVLLLPIVALAPLLSRQLVGTDSKSKNLGPSGAVGSKRSAFKTSAAYPLIVVVGYLLVMGPWFARNLVVVGTPLSAAGTQTLWLTEYDDLFCYNCDLSPSSYLAWGWDNILNSKLLALWINAQRFVAEDCLIFLLPLIVIGLYRLRRQPPFLLASIYLVVIYLAHSLIFTFPGWRGGFFHASSAALPFLYGAAMDGLDTTLKWAARRRRNWRYQQAQSVFATATVVAAMMLSAYAGWRKIPAWRTADAVYGKVDRYLTNQGAAESGVMVGNPPAFWYHTRRPTTVVPNGDVETLLEVADRYEMHYVLLEEDHPRQLNDLHAGTVRHPRLHVMKTWSEGQNILYAVQR